MHLLALDTTTRLPSVALMHDHDVIADDVGDATRSHAEQLPQLILDVLARVQLAIADVDVFAVAAGPGAFTGLRIGIATIQGLALVHGKRVIPVPALEALAQAGGATLAPESLVGAWMDAHRRDVFAALYRVTSSPPYTGARLIEVDAPMVDTPASVLTRWASTPPSILVGDGATTYAQSLGYAGEIVPGPALAPVIGRLAVEHARDGEGVSPAGVRPVYVRRPDAELAREGR